MLIRAGCVNITSVAAFLFPFTCVLMLVRSLPFLLCLSSTQYLFVGCSGGPYALMLCNTTVIAMQFDAILFHGLYPFNECSLVRDLQFPFKSFAFQIVFYIAICKTRSTFLTGLCSPIHTNRRTPLVAPTLKIVDGKTESTHAPGVCNPIHASRWKSTAAPILRQRCTRPDICLIPGLPPPVPLYLPLYNHCPPNITSTTTTATMTTTTIPPTVNPSTCSTATSLAGNPLNRRSCGWASGVLQRVSGVLHIQGISCV